VVKAGSVGFWVEGCLEEQAVSRSGAKPYRRADVLRLPKSGNDNNFTLSTRFILTGFFYNNF
jgi:hypothetical protein